MSLIVRKYTLRFSYVLYLTRCSALRGDVDTEMTPTQRLHKFSAGLYENAWRIPLLFPGAIMLLYVPAGELESEEIAPLLKPFLDKLTQAHAHVRVIPFTLDDVGGIGASMLLGQKLRCARYLPLFAATTGRTCTACAHMAVLDKVSTLDDVRAALASKSFTALVQEDAVEFPYDPVIVRDADSVLTGVDARFIRHWLRSGARWLVYQEQAMGCAMPIGGGIACAAPITCATLAAGIRMCDSTQGDEDMLSLFMPISFYKHRHLQAATRNGATSFGGTTWQDTFMYVQTRLLMNNVWYTWNIQPYSSVSHTQSNGELLWPTVHTLTSCAQRLHGNSHDWAR